MATLTGVASPEASLPLATDGIGFVRAINAAGGSVRVKPTLLSPYHFGAVGDGVADDTAALNAMMTAARAEIVNDDYTPISIDLGGGVFKLTGNGLNMAGIQCWNLEMSNGTLLGHTTGKAVVDCTGSRGYKIRRVHVKGDRTNMPTMPFLIARATVQFGLCDNVVFDAVTCDGYYSVAAFFEYGQETTTHLHCHYWNSNPDAHVAIFEGVGEHPQTSPNKTIVTGGVSHINNVYINVDFRYQPATGIDRGIITGISKSNPAVITCSGGHPFVNGDTVIIAHVEAGMTQINSREGVVANATGTTFELTGVDSGGFSTYTTGGHANRRNTKSAIYMSRMKQHRFIDCYVVSYGQDAIEYNFPDGSRPESCLFDFLQEGAATRSVWRWSGVGTSTINVYDCEWRGYSTHCRGAYFSSDASGAGRLVQYGPKIRVTSHIHGDLPLVTAGSEGLFLFLGADIWWFSRSGVLMNLYGSSSSGDVFAASDGQTHTWNTVSKHRSTGSYSPTITSGTGTITTLGTVTGYVGYHLGDMVWVELSITITTNGTGATDVRATLPFTAAAAAVLNGRQVSVGGQQLQGRIDAGGTLVAIFTDDNTYPGADGERLVLSGWVRKA